MATAEAETSQDDRASPGGLGYDGFISYSHAADDLLAPRLQAGLQRFAKPWWKRRALRIFRDESSLSANPHLWSSITDALDGSDWFVLLLSPEAAESPWVNNEVEYWLEHKNADNIIPVLTDGDFTWFDDDFISDAAPPALQGAFSDEPRWVDLRFARSEDQLDLKNPTFSAAVADIASAIRGVPKDELESEEVLQHRRTTRTAWAAGAGLLTLALLAGAAAVFALDQRNEAEQLAQAEAVAREEADANALEADENAEEAQQNATLARENADEATRNAELARARELGVSAVDAIEEDPELATLLALQAIATTGSTVDQPQAVINAIWRSVQADHLEYVLRPGESEDAQVSLSADDSRLVAIDDKALAVYAVPEGELLWTYTEETADVFLHGFISPDGSRVALDIGDSPAFDPGADPDALPNRIVILDAVDGTVLTTLEYPDCKSAGTWGWSPDGSEFVVTSGFDLCVRDGTSGTWAEVLDGESFESITVLDFPDPEGVGPLPFFTESGELYLLGFGVDAVVRSGTLYEDARVLEGVEGYGAVSRDGALVTTYTASRSEGQILYDGVTGERLDILRPLGGVHPSLPLPVVFTDDSSQIIMQTEGRDTRIWSVASGDQVLTLPSGRGGNPAVSSDGVWLYTSHRDGTVKAWNLEPKTVGQTVVGVLRPGDHVNSNVFSVGPELGAMFVIDFDGFVARTVFFDPTTGELTGDEIHEAESQAMADGRFAINTLGEISVVDPVTGASTYLAGCISTAEEPPWPCDDSGEPAPNLRVNVSLDGTEVLVREIGTTEWTTRDLDDGSVLTTGSSEVIWDEFISFSEEWLVGWLNGDTITAIDRSTGEELATIDATGYRSEISHAGAVLVVPANGEITVIELGTWDSYSYEVAVDRVRGVGFSPDDRRLALGDENTIRIIDLEEQKEIQTIPIAGVSDFWWLDDETLLIGTRGPGARWVTVSLDVSGLAETALGNLTRSFIPLECEKYDIDPCPSLEELPVGGVSSLRGSGFGSR